MWTCLAEPRGLSIIIVHTSRRWSSCPSVWIIQFARNTTDVPQFNTSSAGDSGEEGGSGVRAWSGPSENKYADTYSYTWEADAKTLRAARFKLWGSTAGIVNEGLYTCLALLTGCCWMKECVSVRNSQIPLMGKTLKANTCDFLSQNKWEKVKRCRKICAKHTFISLVKINWMKNVSCSVSARIFIRWVSRKLNNSNWGTSNREATRASYFCVHDDDCVSLIVDPQP